MIQTILTTALSAQLTYLKPTLPTKPQNPQFSITRVLPEENTDTSVVENQPPKQMTVQLPTLKKAIVYDAQLLEPMAGASASPTLMVTVPITIVTPQLTNSPTPTPTTAPTVIIPSLTQAPVSEVPSSSPSSLSDAAITYLGNCEAGMNPTRNSGNGYYGAVQFSYGTWKSLHTGYERADLAPLAVQEAAVQQLLQRSSIYHQFPACAWKMHEAGLI